MHVLVLQSEGASTAIRASIGGTPRKRYFKCSDAPLQFINFVGYFLESLPDGYAVKNMQDVVYNGH
jgi:hypothetical protein